MFRCLLVLTVCVLFTVRRKELLARADRTVFNTLSKGSICFAIDRATDGEAPFGMKLGRAPPDRWVVAAVAARTDCMSLFFEGWNPIRRLCSQFPIAKVDEDAVCVGKPFSDLRGVSPFSSGVCSGSTCPSEPSYTRGIAWLVQAWVVVDGSGVSLHRLSFENHRIPSIQMTCCDFRKGDKSTQKLQNTSPLNA